MVARQFYGLYKLMRNPRKSCQAILEIQERKLRRLVRHAANNVPYYRESFKALNIKPEDIRTLKDLQKLPLTSKKILQELPLKKKMAGTVDLQRCHSFSTSGTTGIPLKIYFRRRDMIYMNLSWMRAYLAAGLKPRDKLLVFVGASEVDQKKSWYEHLGFLRRKKISTWARPEEWVKGIRGWNPDVIIGYVMTLNILGETLQRIKARDISPRIIFHSSAVLDDFSRKFFHSVFSCRVVDLYGSYEGGCIAWECEVCSGYHISSDLLIVEILKNDKPVSPGEAGEVVITNLHSYAMPFIRYQLGDMAVLSKKKPSCGREFPLLENIQGRIDDFIVLRNGQKLTPHPFYHCLDPVPGIRRWRIIQEDADKLTVEIEAGNDFEKSSLRAIEDRLRNLVGDEMEIYFSLVESMVIHPSLKFRAVSSKMGTRP